MVSPGDLDHVDGARNVSAYTIARLFNARYRGAPGQSETEAAYLTKRTRFFT